jgi:hypothetical protein
MSTEVTPSPELAKGIEWLRLIAHSSMESHEAAQAILAALPEVATNPKPELPSEPGWYLDKDNFVWTLDEAGWSLNAHEYAPYTRLVPEKPPIAADEIFNLIDGGLTGPTYTTACEIADYVNGPRA